jgi:hypothetical protein
MTTNDGGAPAPSPPDGRPDDADVGGSGAARRPGVGDAPTSRPRNEDVWAAQRIRELRETTAQLGEQVATLTTQLQQLVEQMQLAGGRHADLAATVSEQLAPTVAGLQHVLSGEFSRLTQDLDQLRVDVDTLLSERQERTKAKNPPVDWAALTEEQAVTQWQVLAQWIGEVFVPGYEITRDELPDCWALHTPVVAELSWLRSAYVQAYLPRSEPQSAADWHMQCRSAVLDRIKELVKSEDCTPGKHVSRSGDVVTVPTSGNGAMPRQQLADPQCWWPFYARAYEHDLAMRRTRAAAGQLNWRPMPASR